jgi:hypothetical protein
VAVSIARCPEHGLHGERDACFVCGGPVEQVAMVDAAVAADRDHWIRLFNRLENAVRRHAEAKGWTDEADDALHAAHRSVLKAASEPSGE